MNQKNKIVLITFGLFMTEAIIHYNIGKKDTLKHENLKGWIPPTNSLIRLGLFVGAFSILNGYLIEKIK